MAADAIPANEPAETEAERISLGLRRKDLAVIRELVERYQYRLVRYLIFLTGQRESVEDWAQETWVRVMDRAAQYDARSRFETWLFSIARNLATDDLRRRQNISLEAAGDGPADRSSPFLAAARSQDAARIAAALGRLEPIYREVLLLRFQEDLSLEEISQVVSAPVSTVSSRIQRGLARLRPHCEGGINAV